MNGLLPSWTDWFKMPLYSLFLERSVITNFTVEWLLFFMNRCNVFLHIICLFSSFMLFFVKLVMQISHWKDLLRLIPWYFIFYLMYLLSNNTYTEFGKKCPIQFMMIIIIGRIVWYFKEQNITKMNSLYQICSKMMHGMKVINYIL